MKTRSESIETINTEPTAGGSDHEMIGQCHQKVLLLLLLLSSHLKPFRSLLSTF